MTYKFTKSDEGKYLFYSLCERDDYFEFSNFIVRVSPKSVAFRYFFFVRGMRSDHIQKWPDIHSWKYGIVNVNENDFPDNVISTYPMRLLVMGCPFPQWELTKEEQQKVVEFEQGQDIEEWLFKYNYPGLKFKKNRRITTNEQS